VPIFGCEVVVNETTPLPVCVIVERFHNDCRELVRIDTEKPFDIESLAGDYYFVVTPEMLIDDL
jgi:hypothetical protein